jgi:hypothetical protein
LERNGTAHPGDAPGSPSSEASSSDRAAPAVFKLPHTAAPLRRLSRDCPVRTESGRQRLQLATAAAQPAVTVPAASIGGVDGLVLAERRRRPALPWGEPTDTDRDRRGRDRRGRDRRGRPDREPVRAGRTVNPPPCSRPLPRAPGRPAGPRARPP